MTFDAGTLVNGLRVAEEKGAFADVKVPPGPRPLSRVGYVLTNRIKGYLVSHAHLDHVAGLVIASPDDVKKPIYALPVGQRDPRRYLLQLAGLAELQRSRQQAPQLKKFPLEDLKPGVSIPLQDTKMSVTAFPLSHGGRVDSVRRGERRRYRRLLRRYRPRFRREGHEDAGCLGGRGREDQSNAS